MGLLCGQGCSGFPAGLVDINTVRGDKSGYGAEICSSSLNIALKGRPRRHVPVDGSKAGCDVADVAKAAWGIERVWAKKKKAEH